MNMKLKKAWTLLRDAVEIWIPGACFVSIFVLFCIQVIGRKFFGVQPVWSSEACSIMYVWLVLIGSSYCFRTDQHIRFTMVCDVLPVKVARLLRFLGDVIVIVLFALSFIPTLKYLDFINIQKSSVIRLSMRIVYGPYVLFMITTIVYTLIEAIKSLRVVLGLDPAETENNTEGGESNE